MKAEVSIFHFIKILKLKIFLTGREKTSPFKVVKSIKPKYEKKKFIALTPSRSRPSKIQMQTMGLLKKCR